MKKLTALLLAVALLSIAACAGQKADTSEDAAATKAAVTEASSIEGADADMQMLEPYSDVRTIMDNAIGQTPSAGNYKPEDIITFWFNADTLFPGNEALAAEILENGKNPGLGIKALHEQGITGKSVNVAIIDQNLAQPYHPEFADRIAQYTDVGTEQPANMGSMHGPAVASLLVGKTCGVAPEANLYFAAAPSWTKDSAYQAEALRWVIETNRQLPEGDKIRVVSISAAPSGQGSPFEKNQELWDAAVAEAQEAGILVLDCRVGVDTGFIAPGYYDPEAPDDVTHFTTGWSQYGQGKKMDGYIYAPTSCRTTAEAYQAGQNSYQFTGQGGLSWAIPYTAGVLALGWQVDPTLTNEEIVKLLFDSAYTDKDGNKIINPLAFIDAIQAR